MADDKGHGGSPTEGWHVVLAFIALVALVGYMYYTYSKNPEKNPYRDLDRGILPVSSTTP